jgi:catalase
VKAGLPVSMDKSMTQGGTGLIIAEAANLDSAIGMFIAAVAKHRHFGREMDPPIL